MSHCHDEQAIRAAAVAAIAEFPPLPDDVIHRLAVILAPLANQPTPSKAEAKTERAA